MIGAAASVEAGEGDLAGVLRAWQRQYLRIYTLCFGKSSRISTPVIGAIVPRVNFHVNSILLESVALSAEIALATSRCLHACSSASSFRAHCFTGNKDSGSPTNIFLCVLLSVGPLQCAWTRGRLMCVEPPKPGAGSM